MDIFEQLRTDTHPEAVGIDDIGNTPTRADLARAVLRLSTPDVMGPAAVSVPVIGTFDESAIDELLTLSPDTQQWYDDHLAHDETVRHNDMALDPGRRIAKY